MKIAQSTCQHRNNCLSNLHMVIGLSCGDWFIKQVRLVHSYSQQVLPRIDGSLQGWPEKLAIGSNCGRVGIKSFAILTNFKIKKYIKNQSVILVILSLLWL